MFIYIEIRFIPSYLIGPNEVPLKQRYARVSWLFYLFIAFFPYASFRVEQSSLTLRCHVQSYTIVSCYYVLLLFVLMLMGLISDSYLALFGTGMVLTAGGIRQLIKVSLRYGNLISFL